MSRSITIMHVLNGASGGAVMSTIALMENLKTHGIQACAVCDDRGTAEERERLRAAVDGKVLFTPLYWWNRKIRSSAWKRPILEGMQLIRTGGGVFSTKKVVQAAARWRPTLIHTNTLLTPEGGKAARIIGIPHVWHLRELIGPGQPFQLRRTGRALGAYLLDHCHRLVANSEVSAAKISPWLPQDFVSVIPNGIDCSLFDSKRRLATPGRVVVAMVANLASRVKKHHLFIEAAGRVDPGLSIDWRIYGHDPSEGGRLQADPYVNSLHALARDLKVDAKLSFPGHVPPERIMAEIDLLVHPTDVESFGRVVIEGMAAEVPIVGAGGGGVAEIVTHGETGLLFQPDDSNDLARCIERMLRDPHLARRCADAGKIRVVRDYAIESTARRVASVYDEVLSNYAGTKSRTRRDSESGQIHLASSHDDGRGI